MSLLQCILTDMNLLYQTRRAVVFCSIRTCPSCAFLFVRSDYCGIIHIRGSHCSWIVKIWLVRGDAISWASGLEHYNARQFIAVLNVCLEVNSRVRKIHENETPTNNNDSTVNKRAHSGETVE